MDWKSFFHKSRVYPVVLILCCYAYYLYHSGKKDDQTQVVKVNDVSLIYVKGKTMGEIAYQVIYRDNEERDFSKGVDSVLKAFNEVFSTYIPSSEISKFNQADSSTYVSNQFMQVWKSAKEIYKKTDGAFDPTVMPLVNAWSFGYTEKTYKKPDQQKIDSIKQFVGMSLIDGKGSLLKKKYPKVQLDFSAIAKGYACDVIINYLKNKSIQNAFVEIGGEIATTGKKFDNRPWYAGIRKPYKGNKEPQLAVKLEGKAIATSGNYENNYYDKKADEYYSHTIDPHTGGQIKSNILSASIVAPTCMEADALATASMVMGLSKSISVIESMPHVEALFIYADSGEKKSKMTSGFESLTVTIDGK